MKKCLVWLAAFVFLGAVATGCGSSVDENKPLPEIKAEAAKMDQAALKQKIEAYQKAIEAKSAEVSKALEKVKNIPLDKMLSDETVKLKDELAKQEESLGKLKDGMAAYTAALQEKK